MKRSLRLPLSLLLLITAATVLTCRTALLPGLGFLSNPPLPPPTLNASLLHLAAVDAGDVQMNKDIDDLLDDTFGADGRSWMRRSISLWRRENHPEVPGRARRLPIRLRGIKDNQNLPAFRQALRSWSQSKKFQPSVMSELPQLVKRPIDLNYGYADTGRPYASCAVVGNSGILLKSEHGELIDGHDIVIRLNNARVEGYQRHVGSRTSVSFINSNILHFCARRQRCFCHPYGDFVPIVMYVCQAVHLADYVACNASHTSPLLVTDPRFDALCSRIVKYYSLKRFVEESGRPPEEWAKTHDEKMFHYSSGMQAVMMAAGICERVSVFGFGKSVEAKHHYHTNQRAELDLHDYEAEYTFYRDLAERPQVIPFLQDSGFKVPQVAFYH